MTKTKNQPLERLTDGSLRVSIWENDGQNGKHYSVTASRCYRDKQGQWKESHSYSRAELLQLARMLEQAYDAIACYRASDRLEPENAS